MKTKIHSKIRQFRITRGYSQEYMAGKMGINPVTYSKIERSKIKLTVERFEKIYAILEVNVADFYASRTTGKSAKCNAECLENCPFYTIMKEHIENYKELKTEYQKLKGMMVYQ